MSELSVERLHGASLTRYLHALASLRIAVFREFPYLYEGSHAYELDYLSRYAEAEGSSLVLARDGDRVIGAATCTPLMGQGEEVIRPFRDAGYDPAEVFYFGESVLLPAYRGRRIGHAFFDHREQAAREGGFRIVTFCAVVRPEDHPRRPANYVPHDAFWTKRGFRRRPELSTHFSWRDLDEEQESEKTMVFWTRELAP